MSRGRGYGRGRGGSNFHGMAGSSGESRQNSRYPTFTDEELAAGKHPFWAKGAAIGHYYRMRSCKKKENGDTKDKETNKKQKGPKEKKEKKVKKSVCVTLNLDEKKQQHIRSILDKISIEAPPTVTNIRSDSSQPFETDEEKYKHISDSAFKRKFLNSITGSIAEKISESHTTQIFRDERNDEMYIEMEKNKQRCSNYQQMLSTRLKLPAAAKREEILNRLKDNNVLLISGETGCGKTTQVPQFILEDSILKGTGSTTNIICTQPRRISAISIAHRVADERAERLGESVGYQIRLEKVMPRSSGSIIFVTTGVVLQYMKSDPLLKKISHIILDEIHERDTLSDFVMALLKDIVPARPDLKVILMSATLNAGQFSKYFNNCPTIHIPGFTYPVDEYYLEDIIETLRFQYTPKRRQGNQKKNKVKQGDPLLEPFFRNIEGRYSPQTINSLRMPESNEINNELIMALVHDISQNQGPGAILIFLPGWEKIKSLHREMTENNYNTFPPSRFVVIPLHSLLPTVNQRTIFDRPPPGVRKVILATNIAETSITIDDVVFVIDCGKIKVKNFDVKCNVLTLKEEWISCANAKQRKGRAGRVQKGVCYHLYVSAREHFFESYQLPEMLRTRLEEIILQCKVLQLGLVAPFLQKVMDPPNPESVILSLELLKGMNALDDQEKLTPLGYHLANLPLDPQTGKMILLASMFSCIDPMFSIAASLSFKDAFYTPLGREEVVDRIKKQFDGGQKSDHLTMAKVLYQWENERNTGRTNERRFSSDNFLSSSVLEQLYEMKIQFSKLMNDMNYLEDSNLKNPHSNVNSRNLALLKALVCGSLYPNVAVIRKCRRKGTKVFACVKLPENNQKVVLHPKSVNEGYESFESRFLVYFEKMRCMTTIFLFDSSMVFPLPLIFFCHKFNVEDSEGHKIIEINNNVRFICTDDLAKLIIELRAWLDWLLEFKVSHPGVTNWSSNSDEYFILNAINELITSEHEMYTNDDDDDLNYDEEDDDVDLDY